MVFSSFIFIFLFLPLCLGCYYLTPSRYRNITALIFSYAFYAWGAPKIILILVLSTFVDYCLSWRIARVEVGAKRRRNFLTVAVTLNLILLFYFKYVNFFVSELNQFLSQFGLSKLHWIEVALPIGISFFTFQKISYLVDVYRGVVPPASCWVNYALYVALFPQLIAGPIIRYHEINAQIESRLYRLSNFFEGVFRFCIGLGKKILLADPMGAVCDNIYALLDQGVLTAPYAWLGIVCYAFQIYFDFSGYSDMAIGLGRMLGFRFPENFNYPYIASSFTEFWRRWHISLSAWMREYLYIPLGGNRVSRGRMFFNLWVVFLLSGLWHGANWTFIVWGSFHGVFLAIEKLGLPKFTQFVPRFFKIGSTFVLVLISWVFFRSDNLAQAWSYLGVMFDYQTFLSWQVPAFRADIIHNRAIIVLFLCFLFSFLPALKNIKLRLSEPVPTPSLEFLRGSFATLLLLLSLCALASSSYIPFLYFKF